ncbi:MAG TPA: T9SS type B sorting domain-containing protein [Flavobacterium sp.]
MKTENNKTAVTPKACHLTLPVKKIIQLFFTLFTTVVLAQPGSLDVTFDNGPSAINYGIVNAIAIQPDGKIIVGGEFYFTNNVLTQNITRLNADGTIDKSFNSGTGANDKVNTCIIQPDGKIIIAGEFYNYNGSYTNRIARLNPDGTLDTSFSPGTGPNDDILNISLQPDGKIIICGYLYSYNNAVINRMARLNSDGSLDTSFNLDIIPTVFIKRTLIQPDGKIIIAGDFTYNNGKLARLNTDGSLDTTFNMGTALNYIISLILQPDGKIIIGGNFPNINDSGKNHIARLNTDGTIDSGFNPGLQFSYDNNGVNLSGDINTISLQTDGKIIIGGWFDHINGILRNNIARLNTDGSIDLSFAPVKGVSFFGTGSAYLTSSVIQTDGKIIVGGQFTNYDSIRTNTIVRLNNELLPPFATPQSVCKNAVVADLTAIGTDLKWYDTKIGGIPMTPAAILNTGTYYVSQTVGGIETARTAVPVTITSPITPIFTQINDICPGTVLQPLPTLSNNGISGTWSPAIDNTTTTTYTFVPTSGSCAVPTTMTIKVNSSITPAFTQVSPVCSGELMTQLPTISNNNITGSWSPDLNNKTTTTYTFTPTTGSCAAIAKMEIKVLNTPNLRLNHNEVICSENNQSVQLNAGLLSGSQSQYSYQWSRNGQLLPINNQYYINVSLDGTYTCQVTDNITSCKSISTNTVIYSNQLTIEKIIISDLAVNNTITIIASEMENSEFSLDNPSGPFQLSNKFENVEPGFHVVYVNNKNGCGSTSKKITVIGAPPYFTPNNDGSNDTWNIIGINNKSFKNSKVVIYDRYGKILKVIPNAVNMGWDGTYNGNPLPADDYWFVINLEDGREAKGHFSLKR